MVYVKITGYEKKSMNYVENWDTKKLMIKACAYVIGIKK